MSPATMTEIGTDMVPLSPSRVGTMFSPISRESDQNLARVGTCAGEALCRPHSSDSANQSPQDAKAEYGDGDRLPIPYSPTSDDHDQDCRMGDGDWVVGPKNGFTGPIKTALAGTVVGIFEKGQDECPGCLSGWAKRSWCHPNTRLDFFTLIQQQTVCCVPSCTQPFVPDGTLDA